MDDFKELIRFALSKEEEAVAFYRFLASMAKQQHIRDLFLQFAGQEEGHHKAFEEMLEGEAIRCRAGLSAEPDAQEELKISDYLVDIGFDPGMSFQDALILGMKREEKSQSMYLDMARKVENHDISCLLLRLAEEEGKHKARLEAEYDREVLSEN